MLDDAKLSKHVIDDKCAQETTDTTTQIEKDKLCYSGPVEDRMMLSSSRSGDEDKRSESDMRCSTGNAMEVITRQDARWIDLSGESTMKLGSRPIKSEIVSTTNANREIKSSDLRNGPTRTGKNNKRFDPRNPEPRRSEDKVVPRRYTTDDRPKHGSKIRDSAFFISIKVYFHGTSDVIPGEISLRWSNGSSSRNWHWFVKQDNWRSPDKDLSNECTRDCGFSTATIRSERSMMTEKGVRADIFEILDRNKDDKIYTLEYEKVYKWMSRESYRDRLTDYTKTESKMIDIVIEDTTQPSGTSTLNTWGLCRSLSTDGRCFFHNRIPNYEFACARQDAYIIQQHWLLANNMFIPSK